MKQKDIFQYRDHEYFLLLSENLQFPAPAAIHMPDAGTGQSFGEYALDGYQLVLLHLCVGMDGKITEQPEDVQAGESDTEEGHEYIKYTDLSIPVNYTGGMVIAREFVHGFGLKEEEYPCFCYRDVMEFLFQDGKLVTTVDHSKAMVRIRKNLKLGLRDLKKGKDARCIRIFLKHSLIGRYRDSFLKKSMKLAKHKVASLVRG